MHYRLKSLVHSIGIFTVVAVSSGTAFACACCTDPGQRSSGTQDMDGYVAGIFGEIHFGPTANVFVSPCDLECAEGIEDADYAYHLGVETSDEGLNFTLVGTENGSRGSILLRLPKQIQTFATDTAPDPAAMSPNLYKEWRLNMSPLGEDAFKAITRDHNAELVLIGRGNSCDSDADFTHWILDVTGEGVDFRLFGAMDRS